MTSAAASHVRSRTSAPVLARTAARNMTRTVTRNLTRTVARFLAVLIACVTLNVQLADAHPIHTTLTVVTPARGSATLMLRVFADDFATVVARHAGQPTPRDSSASIADAYRYLSSRIHLQTSDGRRIAFVSCGLRRQAEVYWACLRVPMPADARDILLQHQVLTELHDDQVNVVQVASDGARRTMLFTRSSVAAPLAR